MSLVIRTRTPFSALYDYPRGWRPARSRRGHWPGVTSLSAVPEVSARKEDGELVFSAKVGDVEPEHLDVTVEDGFLTIKCEQRREREVTRRGHEWHSISTSSFSRRLALPEGAAWRDAEATLEDGVLRISMAFAEEEPKHIEVTRPDETEAEGPPEPTEPTTEPPAA